MLFHQELLSEKGEQLRRSSEKRRIAECLSHMQPRRRAGVRRSVGFWMIEAGLRVATNDDVRLRGPLETCSGSTVANG